MTYAPEITAEIFNAECERIANDLIDQAQTLFMYTGSTLTDWCVDRIRDVVDIHEWSEHSASARRIVCDLNLSTEKGEQRLFDVFCGENYWQDCNDFKDVCKLLSYSMMVAEIESLIIDKLKN